LAILKHGVTPPAEPFLSSETALSFPGIHLAGEVQNSLTSNQSKDRATLAQGAAALGCPRSDRWGFSPEIFLLAFQHPINPWYPQRPEQRVSQFHYTLQENISHCLL